VSGGIHVASFAEEARPFIASLKFAGFVLEPWQTKEKYPVLEKPVGKAREFMLAQSIQRPLKNRK
jgi:hypothetical protein